MTFGPPVVRCSGAPVLHTRPVGVDCMLVKLHEHFRWMAADRTSRALHIATMRSAEDSDETSLPPLGCCR